MTGMSAKIEAMTTPYNVQDYLQTEQDCLGFLVALFDEAPDDSVFIKQAINEVVQARGMDRIAGICLSRAALFQLLWGDSTPSLASVTLALGTLGVQLPRNVYEKQAA
jgi:probable addiction module antidote protein